MRFPRLLSMFFFLLVCVPFTRGTHITGGDFTITHVEGNTFLARLTLFRDCASGGAPFDQIVEITVFDALTNEHLEELDFVFSGFETIIPQLGNSCFEPDVCLEFGIYETEFDLPDNPNGYYLSKERCCRNDLSLNLAGTDLGFVFTVDVPDPAIQNSTPEFGDYPAEAFLCVNSPNTIDFGATDIDGDSLVYSLVDPLRGESDGTPFGANPPVATPKPYTTVQWQPPYTVNNQVGGVPPMTIDSETGVITAQPEQVGIFTVAVQVQEFRNGELIGTIRRELQLTSTLCVIDQPSVINTPNGDTIFNILANTEFCIPIEVTDPNTGDTLFVEGEGPILDGIVIPQAIYPDANGFSTIEQDFCWSPLCLNVSEDPYVVTIRAFSEGCAPTTLITEQDLYFNVILEGDEPTELIEPEEAVVIDLYDPSTHCFNYEFVDPNEADSLIVYPSSEIIGFPNITELDTSRGQGDLSIPFCWDVVCEDLRDEPYLVEFEVVATNCNVIDTTFFTVPIQVVRPPDEEGSFSMVPDTVFWELYSGDTLCFPVVFSDPNFFDSLEVSAESELFNLEENAPFFSPDTIAGFAPFVEGEFCWSPRCENVREEPYILTLFGHSRSCEVDEVVEYPVVIYLDTPADEPASFVLPQEGFEITHFIGDDPIEFLVVAEDDNPFDTLTISATSPAFSSAGSPADFAPFTANETVASTFTWNPECPDVEIEPYIVTFSVRSRSCLKDLEETLEVPVLVTTPTLGEIEPIQNIFTPNGDGKNEVWTIEDLGDPCLQNFKAQVFDRWGVQVYETNRPDFEWEGSYPSGNDAGDGVYFHVIEYFYKNSTKNYSGEITIVR